MGDTRDRWKEVTVTFNDKKIELPRIVAIRIQGKIKVRRLMNREPLLFSCDDKTRNNMVYFGNRVTRYSINKKWIFFNIFQNGMHPTTSM